MKQEIKDNSSSKEFNPVKAMSSIIDAMADKIMADENKELFTGGDWETSLDTQIDYENQFIDIHAHTIGEPKPGLWIASIRFGQVQQEQAEANALLMSQAKNMYYALKLMQDKINNGWQWTEKENEQWAKNTSDILQKVNPYLNQQK